MSAARWERLRAALGDDGLAAVVSEKRYTEDRSGRVHHGVSRSITLRPASGWVIQISDSWWSKNPQAWLGWVVDLSGPDSITRGLSRGLKRPAEVVAAVRLHLGMVMPDPQAEVTR